MNIFNHKKKIIFIVVAALLLFFGGKTLVTKKEKKTAVVKVKQGDLVQKISASGKVRAKNQVDLKFQSSGKLVWVGVKEGDSVAKWQAVASLDQRELEKNIKKKLLAFMNERWDFEQTGADYKSKKDALILTDSEKRILEKAQFDLSSAVLDVEITALAKELAVLVTPIAGIVTNIDTPIAGVNITPAAAVFSVADPTEMVFVTNIDEADIGKIGFGQPAKISLDSYSDEDFSGKIARIDFSSVTTSGGGTAFPIEITLQGNDNLRFKIGMNGDAEVILAKKEAILYLPKKAVFGGKEPYVYKAVGEEFVRQDITTGFETEDEMEITSGLLEGETVAGEKPAGNGK
ncbi:MAG: efflux RND transporter periplasmic adaptor subunit [bacterium]|nr:efflux RND transporter periplasmic adaptor subunit [bacterium]